MSTLTNIAGPILTVLEKGHEVLEALPPEALPILENIIGAAGKLAMNDKAAAMRLIQNAERAANEALALATVDRDRG